MLVIFKPYKNGFFNVWDPIVFAMCELMQIWTIYDVYIFNISTFIGVVYISTVFVYSWILVGYKFLSLCIPNIVKKMASYIITLVPRTGRENTMNVSNRNKSLAYIKDENQSIPDRVLNPGDYQPLLEVSQSIASSTQVEVYGAH